MTGTDARVPARRTGGRALVLTLGLGAVLVSFMQTVLVPVLGVVQHELNISAGHASWLSTATLLAAAATTPAMSRLGDQYGARPALVAVLGLTLAGSVIGACAGSFPALVVARALQGTSTAVFPLAQSVLREEAPAERLPAAMGLVSGMLAFGNGIALVGAGLLTRGSNPGHQAVFWLATALTALTLVAVLVTVPRPRSVPGGRADWLGSLTLAAGLVLLLLPLSRGPVWGWGSSTTLGCLAGALVLGALWTGVERRVPQPMVDLGMLLRRPVLLANIAGLLLGYAMFSQFIGVSALAQVAPRVAGYGFGASVLQTCILFLLPAAMVSLFAGQLTGLVVRALGAGGTLAVGGASGLAGFTVLALAHERMWSVIAGTLFVGVAIGFGFAGLPAALLRAVAPERTGIANGMNSIARSIGSSIASASVVVLLTSEPASAGTTGAPAESRFVLAFVLAAVAFGLISMIGLTGLRAGQDRRARISPRNGASRRSQRPAPGSDQRPAGHQSCPLLPCAKELPCVPSR
ncbi:MFS transporter [Actinoplanes sp. NPDC049316]|uniref:MFS transporter n=1 Tax=Actinoplanes sp. NPDC049316 TaxID=3154727 RepID=UPI003434DF90